MGAYSSDEQTPVQEPKQDFGDFWPEWIQILVFSSSRIIFGSLFRTFTILISVGAVNTSNSILKQDFFGSFAVRLRGRSGSGSKNFGAGSDPDLKNLGSAHHWQGVGLTATFFLDIAKLSFSTYDQIFVRILRKTCFTA